ncbi:MAG: radical SAM family heme chaperone HemW [[Clostridium] fimetarium]|nr:radical SAM family heme chaperone HemW [Alistipes timonensis]MCM1405814.1 radical SAM family heme chaperone HemW [[Clostridium] fimetarium]
MAGLYIHIPFCHGKCAYCDFYSLGAPVEPLMRRYVAALAAEWRCRRTELAGEKVTTLYIGGGTPSALPLHMLADIVNTLFSEGVNTAGLTEFTIEANPEDLTPEWLAAVRELGVNRVSMGVQSFDNELLEAVNRRHDAARAVSALELLSRSGINYSADLIYGLPGQTLARWLDDLRKLLDFDPPHFSAYLLSYEPGTPLHARLSRGEVSEASEQLAEQMYSALCEESASRGYRHYEISAFAKPGREAVHNSAYWNYTPYLGLGCAAHSFLPDGTRKFNPPNIMAYLRDIEGGLCPTETDEETESDRLNDYIITSLRTDTGLALDFLRDRWGLETLQSVSQAANPFFQSGHLTMTPAGFRIPECHWLTADSILRELIF